MKHPILERPERENQSRAPASPGSGGNPMASAQG
jgi:hypothetical protein